MARSIVRVRRWCVLACALGLLATAPVPAALGQGVEYVRAHYTKYEYRIPMRDGARLFTAVYVPKDAGPDKTYPILLTRTPYSVRPYGADEYRAELGPSPHLARSGYIFAYQDVRGRWMSEGEFVNMRPHRPDKTSPQDIDESSDTYDTIDWLLKQVAGHNGRVGLWGISYPGFYTSCGMIDAHPALVAASPQAPICDWFVGDDFHHNGALFLPHLFNFMARFGRPRPKPTKNFAFTFDHGTPDGYDFFLRLGPLRNADPRYFQGEVAFWNEVMQHGTYDAFWQARNLRPHLKDIRPAVLVVGGWFDAENLFGALETYRAIQRHSPKTDNRLVMGPWRHGGWARDDGASLGDVTFGAKTSEFYQQHIELPFFEYHLKQQGALKLPEAWVFETGTNHWRQYDAWPPADVVPRALYVHADGALSWEAPTAQDDAYDEFLSDPRRPVPFIDRIDVGMLPEYMVADQRFAARRPDVLVYESPVLEHDVTLAGPLRAVLYVSTTGTDADWIVKLVDVYPNDRADPDPNPRNVRLGGYQQLVRGEVMRGKFRRSLEKPEPFVPGEITEVAFELPDVYHTFRSGHRIMVQIQSSWFPLVDRNPQQFVDIYQATEADFHPATHRVYRTRQYASRLEVPVLPARLPAAAQ